MIRRAEFPLDLDGEPIATIAIKESELISRFGSAHAEPTDPFCFPGPVKLWGLLLDDGQIVCIEWHVIHEEGNLIANPPDLNRALKGLGLAPERVIWRSERIATAPVR